MADDTLKIAVFAEHCTRAGQSVPVDRDGEIDYDSPDYWVWTGTREDLRDHAAEILREAATRSMYSCRCARTVLDALGYDWVWRLRSLTTPIVYLEGWDDDGEPTWTQSDGDAHKFSSFDDAND